MRPNGKDFDGSTTLLRADRRLRKISGNMTKFPGFRPRSVGAKEIMEVPLLHLFRHSFCCHLAEIFEAYLVELFNPYDTVFLYVAMNDAPLQNLLF